MHPAALSAMRDDVLEEQSICTLISNRLSQLTVDAPEPLRQISVEHLATKGKKIRGRLALQSALTFGVDFERAVDWAAVVELLHNASLIHDDICDGDSERRGKSTVYKQHGAAIAICLGDYYIAAGFGLAALAGAESIPVVTNSVFTSIGGQAREFVGDGYPSWSQYRDIAVRKTAPLLSLPVIGAAAISGYAIDTKSIERYFSHTATCFQIINDLQNFADSVGAINPCSDMAGCRPNAVIACFRDALTASSQASFDRWNDRVRSGESGNNVMEAREWWQRVQHTEALSRAARHLDFHFKAASSELLRLPSEIKAILDDFQRWLACELAKVHFSGTGQKGVHH